MHDLTALAKKALIVTTLTLGAAMVIHFEKLVKLLFVMLLWSLPLTASAQVPAKILLKQSNGYYVAGSTDIMSGNLTVPTTPCFSSTWNNSNFFGDEAILFNGSDIALYDINTCSLTNSYYLSLTGYQTIASVERDEASGDLVAIVVDNVVAGATDLWVYRLNRATPGSTTLLGAYDFFVPNTYPTYIIPNSIAYNGQEVWAFVYQALHNFQTLRSLDLTTGVTTDEISLPPSSNGTFRVFHGDFHVGSGFYLFDGRLPQYLPNLIFSTVYDPPTSNHYIYRYFSGVNITPFSSHISGDKRYTIDNYGSYFKPTVYDPVTFSLNDSPYSISCMIVNNLVPNTYCSGSGYAIHGIAD